jgi:transcriptional regulator with XRE-family HTH domain
VATALRRHVVRQRAKGPIDPGIGARVRALRTARGLTQAQLADTDFTKGFISLLETGRTRISVRAAHIIAERLGVPIADLLGASASDASAHEFTLLHAEGELREGRASSALDLLRTLERRASGLVAARARRLKGRALLADGQARDAVRALDEARRAFVVTGETELALRATFELAQAHGRADQHGEALARALEVERALEGGAFVDRSLELRVLAYLASACVTIGDAGSADLYAERARTLAQDVDDPRAVAHLYMSLAITRQEQGDLEAALQYARRSLAAYEQLRDRRQLASAWNTLGWVYVKRGQLARAAEALDRAQREAEAIRDERALGYIIQTRAELELARGHAKQAALLAEQSARHPGISSRCRALSLLLRAEALAKSHAPMPKVREAFNAAFRALEPEGRALLGRAHQSYFEVLRGRGALRPAAVEAHKALSLLRAQI